jgi:hypothetical protein
MDNVTNYITRSINDADLEAAAKRVATLREKYPTDTPEALANRMIKNKCFQAGAVGAVTSAAAMIPGLGTFAALTFGVAADIGMTFKLQAEMVLEIASAYQHELTPAEKQRVILVVTGVSAGVNQVAQAAGKRIAQKATEQLAQKSVLKAIPFVGAGASAGVNIASTYIIGQRAKSYFSLSPAEMADWNQSARAISGVDERVVTEWLVETTERSWELASINTQNAAGSVIVAGKSTGEVVVISATKVNEVVRSGRQGAVQGLSSVTGKMVETGKWAGASVAATASAAGKSTVDTSKWLAEGVASGAIAAGGAVAAGAGKMGEIAVAARQQTVKGASAAAGAAVQTGKKAGEGVATAANKTTQLAAQTGQAVTKGAGAATGAVASARKKAGEGVAAAANKTGETTAQAGRGVTKGAGSAADTITGIFKRNKNKKTPSQTPDDEEVDEGKERSKG